MTANGLSPRSLRLRSVLTAVASVGVAGQVVAAESLDRHDRPAAQQSAGLDAGAASPVRSAIARPVQRERRPAVGAGHGLGVEAPVARVGVLRRAGRAQREAGHGGRRPVVRQAGDDGEARAAVGAADERDAGSGGRPGRRARPGSRRRWRCPGRSGSVRRRRPSPRSGTRCRRAAAMSAVLMEVDPGQSRGLDRSAAPGTPRSAGRRPSTSMITPALSLATEPARPSRRARAYTNGRKPTPWTTPATWQAPAAPLLAHGDRRSARTESTRQALTRSRCRPV